MCAFETGGAAHRAGRGVSPSSGDPSIAEPGLNPRAGSILFLLSGSIACYKACEAISRLVQRGYRVRTVATESALRFVGQATLEGLTRERAGTDLFAAGAALDHIELIRWADAVVVCPATANLINKMVAGLGDDLASTLLLAHDWKKPLLIAPAMNPAMWAHPATVASVGKLRDWGAQFVAPGEGRTACGEVGEGRLAEPDRIVMAVERALARPARRLRVLITSGGTAEPIDGVRVIANISTGETGALLAEQFAQNGHEVLLLRARTARRPRVPCDEQVFATFAELDAALERLLGTESFDVVIHAAAVSDFSVHSIEVDGIARAPGQGKIDSHVAPVLRLRRNPKLVGMLRRRSRNPEVRIVAFKLTQGATDGEVQAAVSELLQDSGADFVVHNDLAVRSGDRFPADIWRRDGSAVVHCADRDAIGRELERLLVAEKVGRREARKAAAESTDADRPATAPKV